MANPFVGTWKTNWLSYWNDVVVESTLTLTESFLSDKSGKIVSGMFDAPNGQPGTLLGKLTGKTLTGEWRLSETRHGKFTFKLRTGGKSFNGTYNAKGLKPPANSSPDGPYWNGTLIRTHEDVK